MIRKLVLKYLTRLTPEKLTDLLIEVDSRKTKVRDNRDFWKALTAAKDNSKWNKLRQAVIWRKLANGDSKNRPRRNPAGDAQAATGQN